MQLLEKINKQNKTHFQLAASAVVYNYSRTNPLWRTLTDLPIQVSWDGCNTTILHAVTITTDSQIPADQVPLSTLFLPGHTHSHNAQKIPVFIGFYYLPNGSTQWRCPRAVSSVLVRQNTKHELDGKVFVPNGVEGGDQIPEMIIVHKQKIGTLPKK
jgi:hypothetical protein